MSEIISNNVLKGDIEKYYIIYEYPQKIFEQIQKDKGEDKVELVQGPFVMEMMESLGLNKRNEDSKHAVLILDDGRKNIFFSSKPAFFHLVYLLLL